MSSRPNVCRPRSARAGATPERALRARLPLPSPGPAMALLAVACASVCACGPRVDPADPDRATDTGRGATGPRTGPDRRGTRDVLIGEMCPTAAAGRPAVLPLFLRNVGWQSQAADVSAPLERRNARQFAVLGWDGRRVGV